MKEIQTLSETLERAAQLLFLGIVIAGLLIASSMALQYPTRYFILDLPLLSGIGYILAIGLTFLAFWSLIKRG